MEGHRKKGIKQLLTQYGVIFFIGLVLGLCGYMATSSVVFTSGIIGSSMEPTLYDGEYTIGIAMGWAEPALKRGDVINFFPPVDSDGDLFIKRIIGLPDEDVIIEEGKIYINGSTEPIEEPYLEDGWVVDNGPYHFRVPAGHYLVLGDNRNNSYDSRNWDCPYVSHDSIRSKVCFVYWPIPHLRQIH